MDLQIPTFPSAAKLILRLPVGISFVYHGAQKLFGAFGGSGIQGFAEFLGSLGIPYPVLSAWMSGGSEFFCGLALIFGVFARWATLPLMVTMGVAIAYVTGKNGFNISNGGYEYNVVILGVLVAILAMGSGKWSIRN
ncbi:MAG: DoxX family protein [Nitrospinales bacterium]